MSVLLLLTSRVTMMSLLSSGYFYECHFSQFAIFCFVVLSILLRLDLVLSTEDSKEVGVDFFRHTIQKREGKKQEKPHNETKEQKTKKQLNKFHNNIHTHKQKSLSFEHNSQNVVHLTVVFSKNHELIYCIVLCTDMTFFQECVLLKSMSIACKAGRTM